MTSLWALSNCGGHFSLRVIGQSIVSPRPKQRIGAAAEEEIYPGSYNSNNTTQ